MNSKNPVFGPFLVIFPNFGAKFFPRKFDCHAQLHMDLQHHTKIQKKLMIKCQENTQIKGQMEGQLERLTDPIS